MNTPEERERLAELGDLLRRTFPEHYAPSPQPKRAWGDFTSGAALVLSVCSLAWTGGVIYGQQQENTRRIAALEAVDDSRETLLRDMLIKLSRIETDVQTLKERSK